jgi:hypothetical protein
VTHQSYPLRCDAYALYSASGRQLTYESVSCRQLVGSNRTDGQGDAAEAAADSDIRDPGACPCSNQGASANGVNLMRVAATMLVKVLAHTRLHTWQVDFKEPTPAGEELIVRSQVVEVRDRQPRGAKSSVQVGPLRVPVSPRKTWTLLYLVYITVFHSNTRGARASYVAHMHMCSGCQRWSVHASCAQLHDVLAKET